MVLAAALLVPTLAASVYAVLGSPQTADQPMASRAGPRGAGDGAAGRAADGGGLEARLAKSPDDLEGWLMLGAVAGGPRQRAAARSRPTGAP